MEPIRIQITALSTQGEGIGKLDGKVFFVPFTLPGEEWEISITEERKNYNRALPVKCFSINNENQVVPRAEPLCPYFGSCGGCQLQHIPYENQLLLKGQWLEETFQRLAHLEIPVKPVSPSAHWGYRNKVTIPVIAKERGVALAYHKVYAPGEFETIQDCLIAHPTIRKFIPIVTRALSAVKPKLKPHQNETGARVMFRVMGEFCSVTFLDIEIKPEKVASLIDRLFEPECPLDELILTEEGSLDQLTISRNQGEVSEEDDEPETESTAFLQVNDHVRDDLYNYVLQLPFSKSGSVFDGYCGVGILTLELLNRFAKVTGVEASASSAACAKKNIEMHEAENSVHILHQTIEQFLSHTKEQFDTLILNPPRAGMSKEARASVLKTRPSDVVMISCHPAAMVRDMAVFFDAGYRLESIQPFDMFPQTYHLECVAWLERE